MPISLLLPLVAVAAAQPSSAIVTTDTGELERVLADGLRGAVTRGFELAGVESDDDTMTFVLVRAGAAEKHVVALEYDHGGTYRVERTAAPRSTAGHAPSELMGEMLRAPAGGLHLEASCGTWYEVPYVTDAVATGDAAAKLVATTLASADDLEAVTVDGVHASFELADEGEGYRLVATLDAAGAVTAAELRRHESARDDGTYERRAAMRRALKRHAVTAIHDRDDGIVLVTDRGEFEIDPFARAFVAHPRDEEEGCGC